MLKISEFARLTRIPVKTLRYYDDIALLKAAQVDQFTGYRYYSVEQLPRLNRILALKALGLSLEQIKDVLDEDLSAEQIRGMLRLKWAEIHQRLEEERQRLLYVEAKLKQIEEENSMSDYEVILKSVPSFWVASIRATAPDASQLGPTLDRAFDELADYIHQHNGEMSGRPEECGVTLYHSVDKDFQLEAAFGVKEGLQGDDRIQVSELPAIDVAASVVHHGSFATLENAYQAILKWIESNHYEIAGPCREINLQYERGGDQSKYVTEIQFPVQQKKGV